MFLALPNSKFVFIFNFIHMILTLEIHSNNLSVFYFIIFAVMIFNWTEDSFSMHIIILI